MFTLSLLHNLSTFLGWFAPASLWGALFYIALMRTKGGTQSLIVKIAELLALLPGIMTTALLLIPIVDIRLLKLMWVLVFPVALGLLCALAATLEQRLDGEQLAWRWYFRQLVLATSSSVFTGFLLNSWLYAQRGVVTGSTGIAMPALGMGFALTPSIISVFRWLWHNSKLRPGFDTAPEVN